MARIEDKFRELEPTWFFCLVDELYGLTGEEVRVVEGKFKTVELARQYGIKTSSYEELILPVSFDQSVIDEYCSRGTATPVEQAAEDPS